MATSKAAQQTGGRSVNFRSSPAGNSGNLGVDVRHTSESGYIVVVVLLMLLFCLLIPFLISIYIDVLKVQKQAERSEARIEKLLKNLEDKK